MTVIAQDDHLTAGAWAACDQSIISKHSCGQAERNAVRRLIWWSQKSYRIEEVGLSPIVSAKVSVVMVNHQDCRGKKFWTYWTRVKQLRGMLGLILCKVYHIRQRWKRFYRLITITILKPECLEVNQLESLVHKG